MFDMKPVRQKGQALPVGVGVGLLAAALFGLSTPFAKLLTGHVPPVLLAGLLYFGSGIGLSILYFMRHTAREAPLKHTDIPWLAGAVLFGGIIAPVLLMLGLKSTTASTASLLLNLEGVFTAMLAWFIFREHFDRRIAVGMGLIVVGGVTLSWQAGHLSLPLGSLAIAGACLCWGIDNNLTQKVSAGNPYQVAAIKGTVAGAVNLGLAVLLGATLPPPLTTGAAMLIGFLGYGLSLVFFVLALRHLGTARTGAYFSLAPFVGAIVSLLLLHEPLGLRFQIAAIFMGVGVWLHLTERHQHGHFHERMLHTHLHNHDEHHEDKGGHYEDEHVAGADGTEPHPHEHLHEPINHQHAHFPDLHHRHEHL